MTFLVDGIHATESIDEVVNAYYFDPESESAEKFRQELEEKGYVKRKVGSNYTRKVGSKYIENIDIAFEAKKDNAKFYYRTIIIPFYDIRSAWDDIIPPTTIKKIIIDIFGVYRG